MFSPFVQAERRSDGHQPTDYPCMFLATSKKKKNASTVCFTCICRLSERGCQHKGLPGVVADGVMTIREAYKSVSMRKQRLWKLLFPIGRYKLAGTVVFDSCGGQIEIEGEGKETVLLWSSAGDMFVWGPKAGVVGRSSLASSLLLQQLFKKQQCHCHTICKRIGQSTLRNIMVASDDQAKIYHEYFGSRKYNRHSPDN